MECERFKKLLKSWYIQVQEEALAPARMVHFMENHLAECPACMMDPEAHKDVKKIITLVLPQDKLKIASRSSRKTETPDAIVLDDDEDEVSTGEETEEDGEEEEEEEDEIDDIDEFDDDDDD